jgi:hypothetical protein
VAGKWNTSWTGTSSNSRGTLASYEDVDLVLNVACEILCALDDFFSSRVSIKLVCKAV